MTSGMVVSRSVSATTTFPSWYAPLLLSDSDHIALQYITLTHWGNLAGSISCCLTHLQEAGQHYTRSSFIPGEQDLMGIPFNYLSLGSDKFIYILANNDLNSVNNICHRVYTSDNNVPYYVAKRCICVYVCTYLLLFLLLSKCYTFVYVNWVYVYKMEFFLQ